MTLLEKKILAILSEPQLTYPQRLKELAAAAENMPDPVTLRHSGLPIEILYLI